MLCPDVSFFTRAAMEVVSSVDPGSKSVMETIRPWVQLGFPSDAWHGRPVVVSVHEVGAWVVSGATQLRRMGAEAWLLRLNWQVSWVVAVMCGQSRLVLQVLTERVIEQIPVWLTAPLMPPIDWLLQNRPPTNP